MLYAAYLQAPKLQSHDPHDYPVVLNHLPAQKISRLQQTYEFLPQDPATPFVAYAPPPELFPRYL